MTGGSGPEPLEAELPPARQWRQFKVEQEHDAFLHAEVRRTRCECVLFGSVLTCRGGKIGRPRTGLIAAILFLASLPSSQLVNSTSPHLRS